MTSTTTLNKQISRWSSAPVHLRSSSAVKKKSPARKRKQRKCTTPPNMSAEAITHISNNAVCGQISFKRRCAYLAVVLRETRVVLLRGVASSPTTLSSDSAAASLVDILFEPVQSDFTAQPPLTIHSQKKKKKKYTSMSEPPESG